MREICLPFSLLLSFGQTKERREILTNGIAHRFFSACGGSDPIAIE